MELRVVLFAIALASAAAAVTIGAALISEPAGWIIGGLLGAGWAWLILGDA